MAALRKYERSLTTLKNIESFANSIDNNTSYNLIITNIDKLDEIRRDASDALDNATSLTNEDIEKHWKKFEASHGRIKAVLLDAKDISAKPTTSSNSKGLEDSIAAVLNSQKNFFEQFLSTTIHDRTGNISHDIKVPRLNLQPFYGGQDDYKKWPPFFNMFKVSVHDNESISTIHKFQLLNSFLKGEAYDLISHLLVTEENYLVAWNKLCLRYNKKRNIASSYIKQFLNLSQISNVNNKNLRQFADVADEMIRGLDALGDTFKSRDPWLIYILLSKLDGETNRRWADMSSEGDENKSIADFITFLNKRCDAVEAWHIHTSPSSSKSKAIVKSFVTNTPPTNKSTSCSHCHGNHLLHKCFKFISYNGEERRKLVSSLNLCFNCLKANHTTLNCFSKAVCQICQRKHHTLLHSHISTSSTVTNSSQSSTHLTIQDTTSSQSSYSPQSTSQSSNSNNSSCTQNTQTQHSISSSGSTPNFLLQNQGQGLLPTVQVYARDTSGQLHLVRALLDSASMCSFVTESCVQKLGLRRSHACLSVTSLACQKAGTTRGQVEIELIPIHDRKTPIIVDTLIMNKITSNLPISNIDISTWGNLKGLKIADSSFYRPNRIDILIGVKHFYQVQKPEPILEISKNVVAQNTIFGWVIAGQTIISESNPTFSTIVHENPNNIHDILQRFWKLEEVPNC